ncbi:hypothetical protein N7G274_004825 [Stereocaulon virgatum]|uniref:P-loop containing nucleoside triphosphate hydrolase protein n=1 Tax=Stereocaulon virgatum TaxID=373712 RepID=A0ABR4ABU9_9LECA
MYALYTVTSSIQFRLSLYGRCIQIRFQKSYHIQIPCSTTRFNMTKSISNTEGGTRTVPMQVLALGMGRTGTVSMQAALETLGCTPCYHGYTALYNISDCPVWYRAFEAKYHSNGPPFTRSDWDNLLGKYGAVTDVPAICFADELIAAYPEAKVVLVERDIESWYRSFQEVIDNYSTRTTSILAILDPQLMRPSSRLFAYVFQDRKGFFRAGNNQELRDNARSVYKEHYAHVRAITPKERLLDFQLKGGWGPLCEFLGKEIPEVPFPKLHEQGALKEAIRRMQIRGVMNVARNLMVCMLSFVVAWFAIASAWRRGG